ncbi:MAG: hypothetical protein OXB84_07485 [Halobacteriovoraceae bacterium]|nr:hypothetical protein [Halobacteriovoraceae bacterium]
MQSFRIKRKWFLIILILLIPPLLIIYQTFQQNSIELNKKETLQAVLLASKNLLKLWREGMGVEKNNDCAGRCKASFLQCVFEKRDREKKPHFLVKKGKREFRIRALKQQDTYYRIITRENTEGASIPSYGVLIELSTDKFSNIIVPVLLEDVCNDVYLPQRIYSHGTSKKTTQEEWRWDNFSQHVYLDKHLVDFLDIMEWIKFNSSQKKISQNIVLPDSPAEKSLPAHGLSRIQMENFCAFRGKQIMQAHYYDAATFYPGDFDNKTPIRNIRGPYPWSNKSKSFITKDLSFCGKVFAGECPQKISYDNYKKRSTSWIGMFEILGGYPEALENVVDPMKNLKASSTLFPATSSWHALGKRAYWNGEGFSNKDFNWEQDGVSYDPSLPNNEVKISFRCMRFAYD